MSVVLFGMTRSIALAIAAGAMSAFAGWSAQAGAIKEIFEKHNLLGTFA
jgi:hypothetical protein